MTRQGLALVVFWCLAAVPASAQVTYDNSASGTDACSLGVCGGATQTYALTVGSGSNRQLAVIAAVGCNSSATAAATITGITYAGVSLTQTIHQAPTAKFYMDLWTLPAGTQPTSGANNVIVTYSSATLCSGTEANSVNRTTGAIAVAGVDQTTTYSSTNSATGTSTSSTVTLSSSGANDLVIHGSCAGSTLSSPSGTQRWHIGDQSTSCNDANGATASGGTTTVSSTVGSSDSWIIVGGSFKASGGSPPACPPTRTTLGVGCD